MTRQAVPRASRLRLRRRSIAYHAVLALAAFVYMYPLLWVVATSLRSRPDAAQSGLSLIVREPVWSNYAEAWRSARFGSYFLNSVIVTASSVLIAVAVSSAAGFALARLRFRGRSAVIGLLAVSLFLPRGYTILPVLNLVQRLGLLDSLGAIILVEASSGLVINTFLYTAYFWNLPEDFEEAAMVDGAGIPTVFRRIAFPLALPMTAAVILFEAVQTWNSFFVPLVLTLGRPALRTVSVGVYSFSGQQAGNWPLIAAASAMALIPTLLLFFALQRVFVRGLAGAIGNT